MVRGYTAAPVAPSRAITVHPYPWPSRVSERLGTRVGCDRDGNDKFRNVLDRCSAIPTVKLSPEPLSESPSFLPDTGSESSKDTGELPAPNLSPTGSERPR
jgi:hypothetical protein